MAEFMPENSAEFCFASRSQQESRPDNHRAIWSHESVGGRNFQNVDANTSAAVVTYGFAKDPSNIGIKGLIADDER